MIVNNNYRRALTSVCSLQAQEITAAKKHLDNFVYNTRAVILSDISHHHLTSFKIKWQRGTVTVNGTEVHGFIGEEEFAKVLEQLPEKLKAVLGHNILLTYHRRHDHNVKLFLSTVELEKAKKAAGIRSAFSYWNLDDPELYDDEVINKVELEELDAQRSNHTDSEEKAYGINECSEIIRADNTESSTDHKHLEIERQQLETKRKAFATANGTSATPIIDEYGHIHLRESESTDSGRHQNDTRNTLRDNNPVDTRTTIKESAEAADQKTINTTDTATDDGHSDDVYKIILIITNDKSNIRIRVITEEATKLKHRPEVTD